MKFFPIPDDIPEAMQHYLRLWNEPDTDKIRGHIDRAVSEDCWWVDPMHAHTGRDALEENVRGFRETYPSAALGLGSNVDGHNDRHRYEWAIYTDDGLLMRGMDVVTVDDDGLINRVDGFFGPLKRHRPKAD